MITLISQPDSPAFARNQMLFKFYATDDSGELYGTTGVRSQIDLLINTVYLDPGDTLAVEWTEPDGETQTVTFTASDTPNSEDEVPTINAPDIGFTVYSYWSAIAAKIQDHHLISPFFLVYAVNNGPNPPDVFIETTDTDDGWGVTWDVTGVTNPNISVIDYDTPIADTTPGNYRIIFDVFFESTYKDGEYDRILQAYAIPGSDGIAEFDISDVIDNATRESMADLPIPAWSDNAPYIADNLRRYYVRYREDYDDIATPTWINGNLKLTLCGGIMANIWANYDLLGNLKASNAILTWFPDGKTISTDQPEWIPWYNYTGVTKQIVLQLITYDDFGAAIATSYVYEADVLDVEANQTLLIPVGYDQLSIDDSNVKYYTVRIIDAASDYAGGSPDYLSQLRTFYLDYITHFELRYLMFLNGFCLPQTLRCIGNLTKELQVEREESTRQIVINSSIMDRTFQWKESFLNFFTYRSGFLTEFEVDALQELLIYNQQWEVFEEGYIPLQIVDDRYPIKETRQNLYSIFFRAKLTINPGSYSNILIPADETLDIWLTDAIKYWRTAISLPWQIP